MPPHEQSQACLTTSQGAGYSRPLFVINIEVKVPTPFCFGYNTLMTRVTFYLLNQNGPNAEHFACRLTDKAWRGGLPVHIHTLDEADCHAMDRLLWEWREESFLPHARSDSGYPQGTPITLGFKTPELSQRRVLINLAPEVPSFFNDFDRVCEIVIQTPELKEVSRAKFRAYRQVGITPETHNI